MDSPLQPIVDIAVRVIVVSLSLSALSSVVLFLGLLREADMESDLSLRYVLRAYRSASKETRDRLAVIWNVCRVSGLVTLVCFAVLFIDSILEGR